MPESPAAAPFRAGTLDGLAFITALRQKDEAAVRAVLADYPKDIHTQGLIFGLAHITMVVLNGVRDNEEAVDELWLQVAADRVEAASGPPQAPEPTPPESDGLDSAP